MTHDEELIETLMVASFEIARSRGLVHIPMSMFRLTDTWQRTREDVIGFLDAVRAYDAERRSSVLDVDALKSFDPKMPGTLVWLPDGMPSIPTHDPDDYRDLPVAMTGPVRFEGGLTESKRD